MVSELKPCPFCGSSDVGGAGGRINCYRCPATIEVQNTNTHYAGELWNRRAAPQPDTVEPFLWALKSNTVVTLSERPPEGSINLWQPLYTHPPAQPGTVAVPRELLAELCESIEMEAEARYLKDRHHYPSCKRNYDRDIEPAVRARALLDQEKSDE